MITFISIVVLIGSAFLHCSFGESLVLAILTWVVLFILKKVIKSIHEKNVTKKKAKMAMRGEYYIDDYYILHPEKLPKQIHYDYSNTSDNDVTDDDLDDTNDSYDNSNNDSQNLSPWEDRDYVRRNRQGISDAEWDAMTPYEKQLADQEYELYYR